MSSEIIPPFSCYGKGGEDQTSDLAVHNITSCRRRHCDEVEKRMGAWVRAASVAFWMMPRALSATPFSSGLWVGQLLFDATLPPAHVPEVSTKDPPLSDPTLSYLRRDTILDAQQMLTRVFAL